MRIIVLEIIEPRHCLVAQRAIATHATMRSVPPYGATFTGVGSLVIA